MCTHLTEVDLVRERKLTELDGYRREAEASKEMSRKKALLAKSQVRYLRPSHRQSCMHPEPCTLHLMHPP